MVEKKPITPNVAGGLGALLGFVVFLIGGTALWSFVGFTMAICFGLPLGWLLGVAVGNAQANRRRPPGTPPAPVRGLLLAAGILVLLLL